MHTACHKHTQSHQVASGWSLSPSSQQNQQLGMGNCSPLWDGADGDGAGQSSIVKGPVSSGGKRAP